MKIDANGIQYKDLNDQIRRAVDRGAREITLENVNGQRYIGAGLRGNDIDIKIFGVPGNDLAAFMDGATISVFANGQDAVGNTMNSGKVSIHGDAGDIVGYSMRGGKIFIEGDAGYRVGIHMKSYKESSPVIIIGGCSRDFLGEYMAGGVLIVLGLKENISKVVGTYVGTGMHGGVIYIRRELDDHQLGGGVKALEPDEEDIETIEEYLEEYSDDFNLDLNAIMEEDFVKLIPQSDRPYGKLYAY